MYKSTLAYAKKKGSIINKHTFVIKDLSN